VACAKSSDESYTKCRIEDAPALGSGGVKWRTAPAGERIGGRRERRTEFRGGEGVQGAEAAGEFDGRQAALAVEPAEKIPGGALPFLGVAFQAAGNEIAVGIAARLDARHDVVQASATSW
jgi:hypothetical protein